MNTSISSTTASRTSKGFTLVELMIVLAIVSIMLGTGAPAMSSVIRSVQLGNASNDLLWSLLVARSEAVKRKSRVTVCKSGDGHSCTQGGSWEQGWLVFQDADDDGQPTQGERILQYAPPLSAEMRMTGNLPLANYVSYGPTGTTKSLNGGFQAGTITLCRRSAEPADARQIIVSSSGRPRVQKSRVDYCA